MLGFLLGDSHVGTVCLAHTKIPDSQKESRFSDETTYFCEQFRYIEPLLMLREWWKLAKSKIPEPS